MRAIYDITISGYGFKKTYNGVEREFHDEFYVNAIDLFCADLSKRNIKYSENYNQFLNEIETSYTKKYV